MMNQDTSLRAAALTAGIALLVMAIAAPFAELYVYPRLITSASMPETVRNIQVHESLFVSAIFGYLITFVCDVLAAWALYVLLRPVNRHLSLLTSWFRLIYTAIALVALLNLVAAYRLATTPDYLALFGSDQLHAQVRMALGGFKSDWNLGLIFFGIHLGLLGYLIYRSDYIPKLVGALVVLAGVGYLWTSLEPYLFADFRVHIARYTFIGELIFMAWLLIRGWKIQEAP